MTLTASKGKDTLGDVRRVRLCAMDWERMWTKRGGGKRKERGERTTKRKELEMTEMTEAAKRKTFYFLFGSPILLVLVVAGLCR